MGYEAKHRAVGPSTMQLNQHRLRMQRMQEAACQVPVIAGPDGAIKPSKMPPAASDRQDYSPAHLAASETAEPRQDYPWPEEGKKFRYSVMDIPSHLW